MPLWKWNTEPPLPTHLPLPTGSHAVGFQDIMTPGEPEDGVFVRIYYPSVYPLNETINKSELWPVWADDDYLLGFVKFMQAVLERWPSWAPRGEYMFIDQMQLVAPVLHIGCTQLWKILHGTIYCPILKGAPISTEQKWPVIVFSHGMGCSRFAYSRICTDLASHGYIVAATEHRDGSAGLSFKMEAGQKNFIPHRRLSLSEKEYPVRNQQLKYRAYEMKKTLDLVVQLNKGTRVNNVLNTIIEADDPDMFIGRFDLTNPVAAGHSFGGATTLLGLEQDERFKVGLVLDGWLFPMKDERVNPAQPIIFINTESFLNRSNITRMREFLTHPEERRMLFIKGSVHQNHIDLPFIFKSDILKKIIGTHSTTDPKVVMELNNKLMIHFIRSRLEVDTDPALDSFLQHHQSVIIEATDEYVEMEESQTEEE